MRCTVSSNFYNTSVIISVHLATIEEGPYPLLYIYRIYFAQNVVYLISGNVVLTTSLKAGARKSLAGVKVVLKKNIINNNFQRRKKVTMLNKLHTEKIGKEILIQFHSRNSSVFD